jgi:hypothetical protein
MTVDHLIAEAKRNSTGPAEAGDLSASVLSEFLRVALGLVLEEIDYEADGRQTVPSSPGCSPQ